MPATLDDYRDLLHPPPAVTFTGAARRLKVRYGTIPKLVADGHLTQVPVAGKVRLVTLESIDRYLRSRAGTVAG